MCVALERIRTDRLAVTKIEELVSVLKTALPELVTIAFTKSKAELHRIVPGLSDDEWETLVRDETQRRARERGKL